MIHNYRAIAFRFLIVTIFVFYGCVTKVYPDERMAIDSSFLKLFNSIARKDTFAFSDFNDSKKVFVITKVDSTELNKKGWFINGGAFKALQLSFREIGVDTTPLDRSNEISISKAPSINRSGIYIQFNNFYFNDTILPSLNRDTIDINGKKIIDYYLFETSLKLKHPDDVKELYISPVKGFIGFKTVSGETWLNELE